MKVHFNKEIEQLKKSILVLGSMVEGALRHAIEAVIDSDVSKARGIVENDKYIDRKEIQIEEECLKILALYQPVAADLRYVVACLKVNNELERIGDLGVNIAERVIAMHDLKSELSINFEPMMDVTNDMLKLALNSLICMNAEQAMKVITQDDIVDDYNSKMFIELQKHIRKNPGETEYCINLLTVSRQLERIADCATNISEDVIYMIKGEIVRHPSLNDK
jgi:phosphate transport system protein